VVFDPRWTMGIPIRNWLVRTGEHLNSKSMYYVKGIARYLEVGYLVRKMGHRLNGVQWVPERRDLRNLIGGEVGDKPVLYLEFGVYRGGSMRHWSKMLTHPDSILHGFDSFEGFPEDYHMVARIADKKELSTGGEIPVIDDPRVRFFKGFYDESLPGYQIPEHKLLVLNFDCDLYSSTQCVFKYIGRYIVPGTSLYFDEFCQTQDELRSFMEFRSSSPRKFSLRAAMPSMVSALFQCTE
jgi:hypothetical protein